MEFREYYRGVCTKIHFDYDTQTYMGELVDAPAGAIVEADSYEDLQKSLKQAVDDHLSGRDGDRLAEWVREYRLAKEKARKREEESNRFDESAEEPFARRQYLHFKNRRLHH